MARFFVDENLLPVGHALACVRRGDVFYPGHPLLPEVPLGTDDEDWLAVVGRLGLVTLTRDKRIRRRAGERIAAQQAGARLIVLTGGKHMSMFGRLDTVIRAWSLIEATLEVPGPWAKALAGAARRDLEL